MKTKNVTFSIPLELVQSLQANINKRELSKFAAEALKKALKERMNSLKQAYADANNDPGQKEISEDWSSLDNEGWE